MPSHRTDDYWTRRASLRREVEACVERFLLTNCLPADVEALHEEFIDETLKLDLDQSISDGFKSALSITSLT